MKRLQKGSYLHTCFRSYPASRTITRAVTHRHSTRCALSSPPPSAVGMMDKVVSCGMKLVWVSECILTWFNSWGGRKDFVLTCNISNCLGKTQAGCRWGEAGQFLDFYSICIWDLTRTRARPGPHSEGPVTKCLVKKQMCRKLDSGIAVWDYCGYSAVLGHFMRLMYGIRVESGEFRYRIHRIMRIPWLTYDNAMDIIVVKSIMMEKALCL